MSYLDTPIDATVSHYTPNYSPDQIKQMIYDLDIIAKENERFRLDVGSIRKQLNEIKDQIGSVEEYIKQCSSSGDLTDELEHVAKLLDITLVNKYDVIITVTYHGTIEAPADEDIERFEEHVDFEFSAPFSDEWEFDIYQSDTHIAYTEA